MKLIYNIIGSIKIIKIIKDRKVKVRQQQDKKTYNSVLKLKKKC